MTDKCVVFWLKATSVHDHLLLMSPEPVVTNQHVWLFVLTAVTFGDLLSFLCLPAEDIKRLF